MVNSANDTGPAIDLRMAVLNLTNNCNLRCKMCPVVQTDHFYNLPREKAFEVAEFMVRRKFRTICVTGGEPTLVPYFWEFADYLRNTDLTVTLLTNAVRMTEERVVRLAGWQKLYVGVSIDGLQPIHDSIRGEGTFEATTQAIRRMTEAGIRVGVNTVIQKANFESLMEVYEFFKPYALEWQAFSYAEGRYGNECLTLGDLRASVQPLSDIMRRSEAEQRPITLSKGMARGIYLAERFPDIPLHPGLGCTVPLHGFHIAADGQFKPCWHYPWPFDPALWNIHTRTLDDMVDSPEYRQAVSEAVSGKCKGCSTQCYLWDDEFKQKIMAWPYRMERAVPLVFFKDVLRRRVPPLFRVGKWIKSKVRH